MTNPTELPEKHDWNRAHEYDRMVFHCSICEVYIPVTAGDTQAGITLYCPSCNDKMEMGAI